jgi:hypothetical protein
MASRRADRLYEWLAKLPSPEAELILAAGLERAEPAYFDRIVELLFERGSDAAWAGLIASYPRLGPQVRVRLRADEQQMRSGLVRVLRGGSPQGRCNALQALCENPEPALAYVLPDALRASSGDVRRAAAVTLRYLAEIVVDSEGNDRAEPARVAPGQADGTEASGNTAGAAGTAGGACQSEATRPGSARAAVARAVWEALRSFDSHYRLEVAEAALWFAGDLGRDLWSVLANRRSPMAHVVSANLNSWDSPRLARFLLEGLSQPAWRAASRELLVRWRGAERLSAILRNSDLLARRDFREALNSLRRPAWFAGLSDLRELPPELRARAPEWLVLLGYRPEEKRRLLANWSETAFVELRAAAEKAVRTLALQDDSCTPEPDVQSMPGSTGHAADQRGSGDAPATRSADEPPAATPVVADELGPRVEAVREQARRALQKLAQRSPDQTAANQIAELEETLRGLRGELSSANAAHAEEEKPP